MAYRNRGERFRSYEDFVRQENRTIGNSPDYPLTDEDRDRFASEDFTHRHHLDDDDAVRRRERYIRDEVPRGSGYRERDAYERHRRGRDWHDTFGGRGPIGQPRFEAGGGYTEDVGGSAMQNAVRSNRGRGQTDYWEPYTDNAKPFFTGAHGGQVYETDISYGGAGRVGDHLYDDHAHDPDYRAWRESQLRSHDRDYYAWRNAQARNYDASYGDWRRSRQDKFSTEFDAWRASQDTPGQAADSSSKVATDKTGHSMQASQGHRVPGVNSTSSSNTSATSNTPNGTSRST